MTKKDCTAGEKLFLRWRGPQSIIRTRNDFVDQVEYLRIGLVKEVHGSSLKFSHDSSLNQKSIVFHVLTSETKMVVQRLMRLMDTEDELMFHCVGVVHLILKIQTSK